jgi:uncharacterized protein (TIGR04255 family)
VSEQPYKRPPITEAVIEVRFATPLSPPQVEKASNRLAKLYPSDQPIWSLGVAVGVPPGVTDEPTTQVNRELGHRRSTADMSEIALVWPAALVVSQLAPYPGWDAFFARFTRDWNAWKRVVDPRKITQIGVRYINRIDVPFQGIIVEESEFLNVYPKLPASFGVVAGYGVQAQLQLKDIDCNLVINSAAVPSPLIGHVSFVLDLDIYKAKDLPKNDDAIYELLSKIRTKKNEAFEACVTNRARELFQK